MSGKWNGIIKKSQTKVNFCLTFLLLCDIMNLLKNRYKKYGGKFYEKV